MLIFLRLSLSHCYLSSMETRACTPLEITDRAMPLMFVGLYAR